MTSHQKIRNMIGGINNSNKNQLKKISKLEITEERPQVPLSKFYMRMHGKWHYKGMACRLCEMLLTSDVVIDKHRYICKAINKKNDED